ncbi:3-oxoacyl-[acyl-carrier-protein] reductase [Mycobacteroides abscessus subsp. massiliense]|uniref:SDR family NAD(P)-dependent oxidoreductase n=1 Tax=Mycobacteroides abscessus TaxID=36809 RepID=UPI0009A83B8D|nr:SDR family NAD(P)-dependent oxidoreductase [Mycobacteroides abscessus]SKY08451.1 3-oxoacyl-[acyl-carrier-protein] reductase [Mycobacteroides abscessus subsp. massiliense]SKZ00062.1 3-oxoacyl-[acyl-carrier-protein] reductase [Mycobacteroides abscessus subsp. massiliense]
MFGTDVRFDGRVAIVTGAGGGLGREYALLLASRGAKVVVNDIGSSDELLGGGSSDAPANSVVAEIQALGGDAIADTNTVATGAGGRAIVGTALSAWGRVDIVINNAGIVGPIKTFAELTDEDVDTVLGVQLLGPFNVLRPAWKAMVDQGYGRILNISSGSMFGQGEACTYPTAKAGMVGMTTNLGLAGPAYGIKVNALLPVGFTRMVENMPEPALSWLRDTFPAALVAPVAAYLVSEDVPCSGLGFSAGGGRFARVFLSEARGVISSQLTIEEVRDRFGAAMEIEGAATMANVGDELRLYAAALAGR